MTNRRAVEVVYRVGEPLEIPTSGVRETWDVAHGAMCDRETVECVRVVYPNPCGIPDVCEITRLDYNDAEREEW